MDPNHVDNLLKLTRFQSEETLYSEQASGSSSSLPSGPGVWRQEQVYKQGMEFNRPWNSNLRSDGTFHRSSHQGYDRGMWMRSPAAPNFQQRDRCFPDQLINRRTKTSSERYAAATRPKSTLLFPVFSKWKRILEDRLHATSLEGCPRKRSMSCTAEACLRPVWCHWTASSHQGLLP
ncbi:hypothetical protein CEXT_751421 [Caerostris extrusa]|uniref:Uncharacterized protein n=1 Tax=Caerostris extrusa TaxID=172846 RepID=A0AAV4N6E4_CAEEX|nr:hypothetical protein CEXT_751421 [Caerostris extrusa]